MNTTPIESLQKLAEQAPQASPASAPIDVHIPRRSGTDAHARGYALGGLRNLAEKVHKAEDGYKHDILLRAAHAAAGYIPYISESEIEDALYRAVEDRADDKSAARNTIRDGITEGRSKPRPIPAPTNGNSMRNERHIQDNTPPELPSINGSKDGGIGFPPIGDGAGRNQNTLAENNIPASSEGSEAGRKQNESESTRWLAVPLSQLLIRERTTAWFWYGFVGPQLIMLFTGLWKAGKSTFLAYLQQALDGEHESFVGMDVNPARILVVSEESDRKWIERRDALKLGDHVSVICKPFMTAPTARQWQEFVTLIALQVRDTGFDVVIFDTIFNLWSVRDENDAAQVKEALMPLNMITEQGAGIIVAAHPKKGDAREGQATRGTGALPGYVDVICEMRRYDPERAGDARRVLTTYSRFDETPAELVIELDKEKSEYHAVGTKADMKASDRMAIVHRILPKPPTGYTVPEILQHWPADEPRPGERTIRRDLESAVQDGFIGARGKGERNDPRRYVRNQE